MSTWFPLNPEIFFFSFLVGVGWFFCFVLVFNHYSFLFLPSFPQLCWGGGKAAAPAGEELGKGGGRERESEVLRVLFPL